MLPDEMQVIIESDSMFYEENDSGVLIYQNKGSIFQLYLFVNHNIPFSISKKCTPILADFVGGYGFNQNNRFCIDRLKACGFTLYMTARRMVIDFNKAKLPYDLESQQKHEHKIDFAKPVHADAINTVWETTLDTLANPLLSRKELLEQIGQKNIICSISPKNDIMGALQVSQTIQMPYIWRISVLPEYRGKKIAQSMLYFYCNNIMPKGVTKSALWVGKENEMAIQFYLKLGFEFDGRISEQYLLI